MAFVEATPATAKSKPQPGPQITANLRQTAGGMRVRVYLNALAQEECFGASVSGQQLSVKIGTGDDEGRLLVALDPDGKFHARPFLRMGAVVIAIDGWANLPSEARPKASCRLAERVNKGAILELPSWAKAGGSGGKRVGAGAGVSSLAAAGRRKARGH